jgi:hypothetical protein
MAERQWRPPSFLDLLSRGEDSATVGKELDLAFRVAYDAIYTTDNSVAELEPGTLPFVQKTSAYTVTLTDRVIFANAVNAAVIFNLPLASEAEGLKFYFKKIDSSANAMTIRASGGNTIDGAATAATTTQYVAFTLYSNGTNWFIL